jgi:hypothetical protein
MIPVKEFWIDKDFGEDEYKYYIQHMLKEWELMRKGKPYKKALAEASQLEWNERNKGQHDDYKIKKLTEIDGVDVWLVNGKKVRDDCFVDFTEGGHDLVYEFIPKNEIWISDEVSAKERNYILTHEYREREDMKKGMEYDKAHNKASFFERHLRHENPNLGRLEPQKKLKKSTMQTLGIIR